MPENPVVGGNQRDAQHQRDGHPHPLAEGGILQIKRGPVSGPNPGGADRVEQKWTGNAAGERTEGEGSDSDLASRGHSTGNDEYVVDQRTERRQQEQTMREQNRRNHSANVEEDLGGEKNARQMNTEIDLLGSEAGKHPADELGSEDFGQDGAGNQHGGHHGDNDRESLLRVVLAFFGEEAGVDGDKSD